MFKNLTRAAVGALLLALLTLAPKAVFAAACTCDAGGSSTSGAAVLGEAVGCSTSGTACTVTIPGGSGLHHMELQNNCGNDNTVQWNGITAVAGQGIDVPAGQTKQYDITNSPAAIAQPGSSTGINLINNPGGSISVIANASTCTTDFTIFIY